MQNCVSTLTLLLVVCLGTALPAYGQAPDPFKQDPSTQDKDEKSDPAPAASESDGQSATMYVPDPRRTCDGCPPRRLGMSLLQTTGINVFYEIANLARGQVTAHITPKTWWANMQQGWVWDLDDFAVNQIGHPYQGSNYFNAGRANGLSFYESAALTAFGSATWEFFGETNHASLNDFIW